MRWGNFCRCSMRDTRSCGRRLRIVCKQRYAQNQKLSQIGVDTRCMYVAEQSIPGFRGDVYMVGTVQSMQNLYAMRNMGDNWTQ